MKKISLDDIGESLNTTVKESKPKKKATVKAKTTAKKAKVVSAAPKKKKKKVETGSATTEKKRKISTSDLSTKKKERKKKTKKELLDSSEARIKKEATKKKKKSVPAKIEDVVAQGEKLDAQLMAVVEGIPDIVKQENEQIEEYMLMFQNCRSLARIAEKQYYKSKQAREIYPLMQIYNQMRDIIADLRALRDVGKLGDVLNDEVLSPFVQSTASTLINVQQKLASYYKSNLNEKDIAETTRALNRIIKEAAQDITKSYHVSLDKTVQVFSS